MAPTGVEPVRPFGHTILSRGRLPIPPRGQNREYVINTKPLIRKAILFFTILGQNSRMTLNVRIYQPSKNAMQSGRGKTKYWLLEYELETARTPEPLMGWVSSGDTLNQVRLKFDTLEKAVAYAQKEGWGYTVLTAHERVLQPRNYLDNFKYRPHEEEAS